MRRILLIIIVWFSFFSLIQASNTVDERKLMLIAEDIDQPQQITTSINSEYEVFYFANNETPADIINKIIANRSDEKINEILLFSHGAEGEFNFGKLSLSSENISKFKTDFNSLKKVMAEEASFQIYSCNTAKGKKGQALLGLLAEYTETTVFASNNITGKDGDWVLEVNSDNNTQKKSIAIDSYSHNLQTINDDKFAITTFTTTSEEVYEIAIDTSNGDIYYTDKETDAPMYKYDLAGNRSELGIDWTGDNWHTYASTDIEYYNGMILSTLPDLHPSTSGKLVTFDVATYANTYLNISVGKETGSAVVGDFLWTTSGINGDDYYSINLTNNIISGPFPIGSTGSWEGLEYCEATGKLYYMSNNSGIRVLNMDGSGVDTEISTLISPNANFAIDPHGQFAYVRIGSEVHQIDLVTGTTTVFITGLTDDSGFDLEFGPSSLNPGGYSLYIGDNNKIYEVNSTIITQPVTLVGTCTPQTINVDFTAGTFNAGNVFTAQLSDATGSFANPEDIGTLTATTSGTIHANIPVTPYGTGYRIRVISSDPITYGFDNGTDLTIGDNTPPTITCATPAASYDADPGQCYYTVQGTELDPIATDDNCGVYTYTNTINGGPTLAGEQIPVGTTNVIWVIVDNSFNISVCSYDVVVEDLVPPTITCVPNVTKSTNGLDCTYIASGTEFDATATDDHCDPILTHDYAAASSNTTLDGAVFPVGVHTITWTATDGTTPVTCQTIITVEDITAPTLLCQNATIQLDETGHASITIADVTSAPPFDDCGIASTSVSPDAVDCTNIGTPVVVTVTATDNYGNTASCDATVTVEDQIDPIISCSSIEVELDENGQIVVTPEMFSGILTISGDNNSNNPGTTDFTVPVITDETITFSWSYNTDDDPGWDSFGYLLNDVYTVLSNPNETYQTGTTTVSVVAGDVFGFRSYTDDNIFGSSTTTVYDFIPGFTGQFAQANWILTLTNSDGYAGFVPYDACGIATEDITPNTFTCADMGDNNVLYTVVDNNGNSSSCNRTVTVLDQMAPIAKCKSFVAELDASGSVTVDPDDFDDGSTDNCTIDLMKTINGAASITYTCADMATGIPITLELVDGSGNLSSCNTTVDVVDLIAPVVTGSITETTLDGCEEADAPAAATTVAELLALDGDLAITDNCTANDDLVVSNTDVATGSCPIVITRTYTVTDLSNNASVDIIHTINIQDVTIPTFTAPLAITIYKDADCNYDASVTFTGDVTDEADNCSVGEATYTDVTDATDPCSIIITRTWSLVDDCNNAAADQVQIITVEDNTLPTFTAPADITIYKDADCNYDAGVAFTGDVTDEADNCLVGEAIYADVTDATNPCSIKITRTWSLVDDCGNAAADQVQTITVEDNTPPTFTVPADITIYKDADCNYDASIGVTGDVTDEADNCSTNLDATYSDAVADGSCEGEQIITRTWSLVDDCNNAAADQVQIITVEDNTPPTFTVPADITIYKDADCNYDASVTFTGDVTDEADNCSVGEATYTDVTDATDPCSIIITRTWSLVDDCNNAAADQVQIITVKDNTPPTFTVPADITIYKDADCNYDAGVAFTGDVTDEADNCSVGEATYADVTDATDPCSIIITRTWSLVDDCGNAAADQVQTITVEDDTPPTFTVPADITIYKDADCNYDASIGVTGDVADEADNCTTTLNATFTDVVADGSCEGEQIITRTWSLVDDCNNAAADQVQIITVEDNTPPTFTAPLAATIYKDADCNYDAGVAFTGDVTDEADNCSTTLDATYSDAVADGSCEGEQIITRTWSLVDDCGNAAVDQVQIITVEDNIVPTFTAPVATTIYKDADCNYDAGVAFTGDVTDEADNCSVGEATYADVTDATDPCSIIITRTWSLVDDCGNAAADQVQTITVKDNTPPTFTVPADITIDKDENCNYDTDVANTGDVTDEADNCTTTLDATFTDMIADGSCESDLIITRTWTLTDDCGNTTNKVQTISVEDNTPPTVVCQNITIQLDFYGNASIMVEDIDGGSSDACSTITLAASQTEFTCENVGDNSVTLTVTDACGNVSTCDATVTVEDHIAPVIGCANIEVELDENGQIVVTPEMFSDVLTISGDNNSDGPGTTDFTVPILTDETITFSWAYHTDDEDGAEYDSFGYLLNGVYTLLTDLDGNIDQNGTETVNVVAGDVFGFRSYTEDNIYGPCVTTVSDFIPGYTGQFAQANWTLILTNSDGYAGFTPYDACGIASNVVAPNTFTCADIGDHLVTHTVEDIHGNISTCTSTVTIVDLMAPIANCKPFMAELDDAGSVTVYPADFDGGSTDNCAIDYMTINGVASITYTCEDIALGIPITLEVFDQTGNSISCETTLDVVDGGAPVITCVANTTKDADAGVCTYTVQGTEFDATATDNCSSLLLINNLNGTSSLDGEVLQPGVTDITWTADDGHGQIEECHTIITVEDYQDPVWVDAPTDMTVECDGTPDHSGDFAAWLDSFSGTDNCGTPTVTNDSEGLSDDCGTTGTETVTFTLTDGRGNSITKDATFTIEDNTPPTAVCQNISIDLDPLTGLASIEVSDIDGGSTDVCGDVTLAASQTEFTCFDIGDNIVTLTVTDDCGNISTCDATVTVVDDLPAVLICPDDKDLFIGAGCEAVLPDYTSELVILDVCGVESIVQTPAPGTVYTPADAGSQTIEFVVTDFGNNTSYCSILVEVIDAEAFTIDNVLYTNVECHTSDNASIVITTTGGPSGLFYSIDGVDYSNTTGIFNNLEEGAYTVSVKNINDCITVWPEEIVISQPDELIIDAVDYTDVTMCYGNDNATIDISVSGGTPDYLYSIDGGATYYVSSHFENLAAGDYNIMVSDDHACEANWETTITIVQPDDFVINSITVVDVTGCYGDLTGEIHIDSEGATGVHRYSIDGGETWHTNEGHFTGLAAGLYDLKIEDGNGCFYVHPTPIEVMQPELLVASDVIVTDVTDCFDNSNGALEVLITGGTPDYTYSIDGGATYVDSPVFENLTQGDYHIFVQDANGCISEYANNPVTVGAPIIISMTVESTDVTGCSDNSDGSITIAATGGTGVYEYTVDGGTTWSSDPLFANLIAGSYTVMTKDDMGCEQAYAGNPVVISAPDAINITLVTSINADCYGVAGGNITITADGGNGDLSYSIDGGISFQVLNVFVSLPAGVYNVMVKDDNNCEVAYANNPVIISEPEAIVISDAVATDVSCDNSILGTITITASGGSGNLTYSINNGEDYYATNEFTDLIADTYIVRVMDENGCMILYDGNPVVVEQLGGSVIVINKTPDYGTICVGEMVSLEAIAEDAVTYTWEDGSTDAFREVTSDVSGTVTYTVTVVNESGCTSEESIDIFYDECLGLPEMGDDAMTINIYPNPNTGEFTLELNGVSQEIKISIIDFAGRLIIEQNVIDFTEHKIEKKFNLSDYERGVYFLRIIQGEKISYKKVVVQ